MPAAKDQPDAAQYPALEVRISGSYRTAGKDIIDFDGLTGIIPACDEDVAEMHIQGRYAAMWIRQDGRFKERNDGIRQLFVDKINPVKADFSFAGKDIKDMTEEELQDLATAYDLRTIPLYRDGSSRREVQIKAYEAYTTRVLKQPSIEPDKEGFNFGKLPPLHAAYGRRRELQGKITNEEILDLEQRNSTTQLGQKDGGIKSNMKYDELVAMAKEKDISFTPGMPYDDLYKLLFQGAVV